MKYLESPHIAYLCKGLTYLNFHPDSLITALETRIIENSQNLSAYAVSKAMFFFQKIYRGNEDVIIACCTQLSRLIKESKLNTLYVKDFKDIIVSLSHIAYDENHFVDRVTEFQPQKIESTVQSLAIKLMREISPYVLFKLKQDSDVDNPRAAKFQTLSSIVFAYTKA